MIRVLNRHHRWLMIVIAILAIPFCFYFVQKPDFGAAGTDRAGRVYDRDITKVEFQRNARLLRLSSQLGMSSFIQDLTTGAMSENDLYEQFIFNRMVLRHEADRLGIRPSPAEVTNAVKGFRVFQGASGFDFNKYTEFSQRELGPMGFTDAQIEELAGDQLRLAKLKTLLGVGIHIPEVESKANYEQAYGKIDATVVRLRSADFEKEIKMTDEDIAKYYEAQKAQLKSEEKRKVQFIALELNEEQKKLAGKERIDVLQKLADRANEVSQALLEKGAAFDQVAAKFQLPIRETSEFTAAAPDPQLGSNPQVAQTAFQLSPQEPNSDAVQGADGFYLLHLVNVAPARPLLLEEARPKIVEALKAERLQQIVSAKASEAANKIREAVHSNQPIDGALQQIGLKAEMVPPFTLMDSAPMTPPGQPKDPNAQSPDLPQIKQASAELSAGDVSEFVPTKDGGLIVAVEKREPPDESTKGGRASLDARYVRSKRELAFHEWLREQRQVAGIVGHPAPAVEM